MSPATAQPEPPDNCPRRPRSGAVVAAGNGLARLHLALRGGRRPTLPIGEALHPVTLAAAIVLVVNDWVLKRSAAAPAWLTGKLSDVAGLVVAPLALTAAVGLVLKLARVDPWLTRRRLAIAIAATAAVFATVKLSAAAAAKVGALWGHVARGAHLVADPTDLIALPALAVAWWIGGRELAWIAEARSHT